MRILICEEKGEKPVGGCLRYYLLTQPLFDAAGREICDSYGIEIEFLRGGERESCCVEAVDVAADRLLRLIRIFAAGKLMPVHLREVLEDMADELLSGAG